MCKMRQCPPGDEMQMKNIFSRRNFVCSGALVAAGFVASKEVFAVAAARAPADEGTAIRLGLASYTFRNFSRPQMIGGAGRAGRLCRGGHQASRCRNHLFRER